MAKSNITEAIIGLFVLIFVAIIAFFTFNNMKKNHDDCYKVSALFSDVTGLNIGSSVKVSGVNVGIVTDISLEGNDYMVKVEMCIDENLSLPTDSVARISNSNLLENKFINIYPGSDSSLIGYNGVIEYTQFDMSISKLVDKAIASLMEK